MLSPQWRTLIAPTLLICILLYAALLRLDALFKTYGPYEEPHWLAAMQAPVTSAAAAITPDWPWRKDATPYAGGDPINYLKFAREMTNFYAAHVREPMFPAMTRLGLWLTGNADVGVSITSIAFALLALVATYALGALVASPAVGLAAAAMLAIDQSAVSWAIGGWRDELFAFFAVSCAWAWTRFSREPTHANAVLAGVLSGGACLTRITTIALIAPAVIWIVATSNARLRTDGEFSARRRGADIRAKVALAVGVMAMLVAPFLINCAIATGDPFYAINNHTDFYLKREAATDLSRRSGAAAEADVQPISAVSYSLDKFESLPIAATDNAVRGVFVYPFANKWVGLDEWLPGLGTVLAYLAIAGLVGWMWSRDGRLLLFMFFVSLIPFSMTWTVLGGAEWRLTLFAYSFYLVAAFWLVDRVARFVRATVIARDTAPWEYVTRRETVRALVAILVIVVVGGLWAIAVPYAVAREALTHGEAATIMAGPRDRLFFLDGWSGLVVEGNVTMRFATEREATIRLLFPEARPYQMILRSSPVARSSSQQILRVSLNGNPLADLALAWNPDRIGEHLISVPANMVTPGVHHLTLRSDAAFKVWYVRITAQ